MVLGSSSSNDGEDAFDSEDGRSIDQEQASGAKVPNDSDYQPKGSKWP